MVDVGAAWHQGGAGHRSSQLAVSKLAVDKCLSAELRGIDWLSLKQTVFFGAFLYLLGAFFTVGVGAEHLVGFAFFRPAFA